MTRRSLNIANAVALLSLAAMLAFASPAQANHCNTEGNGAVYTIHTNCAMAGTVIEKAAQKVPARRFRVYVRGWWHCNFARIAGHPTVTCERHYGTPRRQVVIAVI